ncbi:hypothetical protein EGW08_002084, partial [Elysia chlorotica]
MKTKCSVEIKNVGSDQIVQHILPLQGIDENKKLRKTTSGVDAKSHLQYTFSDQRGKANTQDEESSDEEEDQLVRFDGETLLQDDEEPMIGKSVFKFRTPKKSGQMVSKALDSFSPTTAGKSPSRAVASPLAHLKSKKENLSPNRAKKSPRLSDRQSLNPGQLTPKRSLGVAAVRDHKKMESSTPYRLRQRQAEAQQEMSEEEDSVDESSEEEEGSDNEEGAQGGGNGFSSRVHASDDLNTAASAENYFDLHAQTPVTSDRTLASLEGPRLDVDTVRSVLAKLTPGHSKHRQVLVDKHASLFNKWMLHMCSGFNVLLHGLGSKRNLLEQFREKHLSKFSHLVVNGYFPSLTVKHILNSITEDLLESSKGFTNPQTQLEFIKEEYRNKDEDVFLVIHNIDGVLLRSDKCQAVLSQLAEVEGFHIIASLDHINAGFMWDQTKFFRFRWLWYETPTFAPYEAENSYENSLLVQQSGGLALSSLAHVMRSLTPNARQIFLVLAEYQLENGDSANYT